MIVANRPLLIVFNVVSSYAIIAKKLTDVVKAVMNFILYVIQEVKIVLRHIVKNTNVLKIMVVAIQITIVA